MKSTWKYIVGLLAAVVIIFVSIMSPLGKALILNFNRAKWEGQNITHYRFKLDIICLCMYQQNIPVTIEVKDGHIISIKDVNGMVLDNYALRDFERAGSVEKLFNIAQEGISKAFWTSTSYDAKLGFPQNIELDWNKNVIDDERTYRIIEFEVFP